MPQGMVTGVAHREAPAHRDPTGVCFKVLRLSVLYVVAMGPPCIPLWFSLPDVVLIGICWILATGSSSHSKKGIDDLVGCSC